MQGALHETNKKMKDKQAVKQKQLKVNGVKVKP